MQAVYRSAPSMQSYAPAKCFSRPLEALRHAQEAADAFRVGYAVYRVLAGRPLLLRRFPPGRPVEEVA